MADTSALLALMDRHEERHGEIRDLFEATGGAWVLPAAILAEVDYHVAKRLGATAHEAWLADLGTGAYTTVWHDERDLQEAVGLHRRYSELRMGLVDALVMASAERLRAKAIVTLDERHFGAVRLVGEPALWPRDAA